MSKHRPANPGLYTCGPPKRPLIGVEPQCLSPWDTYLGGEINGAKAGRGSPNKQAFLIAVQTDKTMEQVQYAVAEPVPTFDKDTGRMG
ncbi:MAG: hypothetical protein IPK27_19840 [Rhodanobacteraceae bacterium]|nr:hypothetical protein [Rhodanobacteraceae bacterium]